MEPVIVKYIKNADRWLFVKINHDWTSSTLDSIFPLWREAISWAPLYFFLLVFMLLNFGGKAWLWILGFLITVTLTDQVSSHLIKTLVNRPRPCLDPLLADKINLVMHNCSTNPSFTSSHAANHFGMAVFVYCTLKQYLKKWSYLFFVWAATIAYGQVYIGVHYPTDIICGGLLGSIIGYFTATLFNKKAGLPALESTGLPLPAGKL